MPKIFKSKQIMECVAYYSIFMLFRLYEYGHHMETIVNNEFLDKLTEENNHLARKFFELAIENMDILERMDE